MYRVYPKILNPFEGIAKGERAYTRLPTGLNYQEIVITSNVAKEHLKFYIELGGKFQVGEIVAITGTESEVQEKYKGAFTDATHYLVTFGNREAKSDDGEMYSGLELVAGDECILYAEVAAGAVPATPSLTAVAYVKNGTGVRKLIPFLKPHTITVNAVGEVNYSGLPQEFQYKRLWMQGDVSKVTIWQDGRKKFEDTATSNDFMAKRRGLTPQTGYFVVDFIARGWAFADLFNPVSRDELEIKLEMGTAANVRMLAESVKILSNPHVAGQ